MRVFPLSVALLCTISTAAFAGDKPIVGPVPNWVKPAATPGTAGKDDEAPFRLVSTDQQVLLQPGKTGLYSQVAIKIQKPEGLAAGNVSLPWRPDTDEFVVHYLRIRRGEKLIDVLAGKSFTILRRETNLEMAVLDGVLTANIQAEGLQIGDTLEMATTITSSDPVLKGHVEAYGAAWNLLPIDHARLRMSWPQEVQLRTRAVGDLPPVKPVSAGGLTSIDIVQDGVRPRIPPKGAPLRFAVGRMMEATDFASWADLATLLAPLYEKAATLAPNSPLKAEIERIKAASADPGKRAEAALALVQERIRYVALAMGAGGLTPADADATWERRYGDCKAKTALLLALLHGLGITADPVVVNSESGDGFDERLPMIGLFNHVLVRATIDGKPYWLDGTRTGDKSLARLQVPAFSWGLPLLTSGATLVKIMPPPLAAPTETTTVRIDASGGILLPAPIKAEVVMRGDSALVTNTALASMTGDTRESALRKFWRDRYDFVEIKSTAASFDAATGEERLTMEGLANMDWSSGWYETDGTRVGYRADFSRDPGPNSDAPFAVGYPYFEKVTETIVLPAGFPNQDAEMGPDVNETVAGIEYHRTASMTGNVATIEKSERSIVPEFPANDAPAAEKRLRELSSKGVYLKKPANYAYNKAELEKVSKETPKTAEALITRGTDFLNMSRYDDAIGALTQALAMDPKNATGLANRGLAHAWKHNIAAAEGDVAAALAIDPNHPLALRAAGLATEFKGDFKGAIAAYGKALAADSQSEWTYWRRAIVRLQTGDRKGAIADADAGITISPEAFYLHGFKGFTLVQDGQRDAARAVATALVTNYKDKAEAQVNAAYIYHELRDRAAALAAMDRAIGIEKQAKYFVQRYELRDASDLKGRRADLDTALKMDPKFAPAWAARAEMAADAIDIPGAIKLMDQAIQIDPSSALYLSQRASLYIRANNLAAASKDTQAILSREPQNPAGLALQAEIARRKGGAKAAVAAMGKPDAKQETPTVLGQRAQAEYAAGDEAGALRDSEAALRGYASWYALRSLRAAIFREQGKMAEAEGEITAMLRDGSNDADAHVTAAYIYTILDKKAQALSEYDAALALKPASITYVWRSKARADSDRAGKLADLDEALKLEPESEAALDAKAELLRRGGDYSGAIAVYDAAIARRPNPGYRISRGVLWARKGDAARAREDLDAAQADPQLSDASGLNSICWALATANVELPRALKACDAGLAKQPGVDAFRDSRALVLLRMGRADEAIATYTDILSRSPKLSASLYGRALAWAQKGEMAKAQADAKAAVAIDATIAKQFEDYGLKLPALTPPPSAAPR